MQRRLAAAGDRRLEGLCDARALQARIRIGLGCDGVERVEARFPGAAFSPHRHDTYAIGITLAGVQRFRYRGEQRHCLPGQCHILHPDEIHDGAAGTPDGFAYRIVYIDPSLIGEALGGGPLPFVSRPVIDLTAEQRALVAPAFDMAAPIDDLRRAEIATALADLLSGASSRGATPAARLPFAALRRVRALIAAQPARRYPMDELERTAGLDRWSLARAFRAAFGTSPSRFRTLRQLDEVRRLLTQGAGLAEAALDAGFADQSHMSRQFKRAYGLTPARWAAAARRAAERPA
jgi:AraC-like DNA-binding protein